MKKKCNLLVMLVCLLALGLVFIGCPTDSGGGGGSTGTSSGGVKNRATITIKNQLNTSIRVTLEDAWDPKEEDAPKILSGLGTKTIGANAEGTWSLECSGGKARVNIEINGVTAWLYYDVEVGKTCKLTFDRTGLNES